MRLAHETRTAYLAMLACVVGGGLLTVANSRYVLDLTSGSAVFACYVGFAFIWLRLMEGRFLHPTVRRCVRITGALMVGWLFVRTVKYEFSDSFPELTRYAWYSYYIFYLLIPAFLLLVMLHTGKRADERIAHRWWCLPIAGGILAALFLTNDLHQLAFRFTVPLTSGQDLSRGGYYTYGPLFFVSWAWTVLIAGAAVGLSFFRAARRKASWRWMLLLVPLGLGAAYSLTNALHPRSFLFFLYKFPETACFLIVAFVECLVRLGLYPANEGYQELWHVSTLRGGFMDERDAVAFASAGMPKVTGEQVRAARERGVRLDADNELSARAVSGGTAFWLRDLSRVHGLRTELEELGDVLAEENAMLAAETELTHEREALAQHACLHERVLEGIAPAIAQVEGLLAQAETAPDEAAFLACMRRAAAWASYAKRYANLMLLGEAGTVDVRELALATSEVAGWLRSCGASEAAEATAFTREAGEAAEPSAGSTLPTGEALALLRGFFERWDGCLSGGDAA